MKFTKILYTILILLISINYTFSQGGIVAYYRVATFDNPIHEIAAKAKASLLSNNFQIIGEYSPGNDSTLNVIVFTREDLINITSQVKNRGSLAAALRIGIVQKSDGKTDLTLLNPEFLFYGYLGNATNKYELELNQISMDVKQALFEIGTDFEPFIKSSLTEKEIKEYRFMLRNPSFNEPVIIKEFGSFEEAVNKIQTNLKARKDQTIKVYEIINNQQKVAVFGVGLLDQSRGEPFFLSQLGTSYLAALPYEIIVNNNQVSILHGKYRFPFYWADLTMNDYRKIYKTPRDIEEIMKDLAN